MSTYILIHGAWHGAWCWQKIIPLLEQKGHKVIAPDLPGHGNDKTPVNKVSLKKYVTSISEILLNEKEPLILVGHSMAGIVLSQTTEQHPDKINKLVYITGFLLESGKTISEQRQADTESLLLPNLQLAEDNISATVKQDALKDVFYNDCSTEDIELAKTLLVPQALLPFNTPVKITEENFGRVPRIYIETLQDHAITHSAQKRMYNAQPCRQVITMNTDHSPFFSAPEELAEHLLSIQ